DGVTSLITRGRPPKSIAEDVTIEGHKHLIVLPDEPVPQLFAIAHVVVRRLGNAVTVGIPPLLLAVPLPVVAVVVVVHVGVRDQDATTLGVLLEYVVGPGDDL